MSQQVFDIDTTAVKDTELGNYFDFYVNNTFYLYAPDYYYQFYAVYLRRCISVYDGWVNGFHNTKSGLVPQRLLQSITNGLNNMLFAHGIDFSGDKPDYCFATKWAKKTKFYKALKKAHKYAIAGGTSLLKLNRKNSDLYVTAHRIDTFFVDLDSNGNVTSAKIYFDVIQNTNATGTKSHYGICEERYYNEEGVPCIKQCVYRAYGNLQTSVQDRPQNCECYKVNWENLPNDVKKQIKESYPSVMLDKEQYLPFYDSLGCFILKFTDDIPQIPNSQFGQPIGDILFTENFQYDQMKYFEKNEVDLARARALVPEEFWNKDDPDYDERALNERFYQKVSSLNGDNDKVTPIQFQLRGNDMRVQKENIYKDIALKLQISASSVASFLNEGEGARTATEIVSERTKSDTWLKGQINLNTPEINELLRYVMSYYNMHEVEIVFKAEDQSPYLDKLKTLSDVYSAGNMTPDLYVEEAHKNLNEAQKAREIEYLKEKQLQVIQQPQTQIPVEINENLK